MAADAWEARTARLEGVNEQIDRRLGALETRLGPVENRITALDQWMDAGFAQVRSEMRSQFHRLLGVILTGFSVMLSGFLALAFRMVGH